MSITWFIENSDNNLKLSIEPESKSASEVTEETDREKERKNTDADTEKSMSREKTTSTETGKQNSKSWTCCSTQRDWAHEAVSSALTAASSFFTHKSRFCLKNSAESEGGNRVQTTMQKRLKEKKLLKCQQSSLRTVTERQTRKPQLKDSDDNKRKRRINPFKQQKENKSANRHTWYW